MRCGSVLRSSARTDHLTSSLRRSLKEAVSIANPPSPCRCLRFSCFPICFCPMPRIMIPPDDLLDRALRSPSDPGTPMGDSVAEPASGSVDRRGVSVGNKRPRTSDSDSDTEGNNDASGPARRTQPVLAPPGALAPAAAIPPLPIAQSRQLVQGLVSLKKLSDNSAQELFRYGRVSVWPFCCSWR
jgi:hypothetical protein